MVVLNGQEEHFDGVRDKENGAPACARLLAQAYTGPKRQLELVGKVPQRADRQLIA